eukprot:366367-Chlamydomonas_euryale.AAC.18
MKSAPRLAPMRLLRGHDVPFPAAMHGQLSSRATQPEDVPAPGGHKRRHHMSLLHLLEHAHTQHEPTALD